MKLDILAFGAHPDDVEMGCGGTIAKSTSLGKKVGIIDLTRGEMGTRGTASERDAEAIESSNILGLHVRDNLKFRDCFFEISEEHLIKVIEQIRRFRPSIVLCNAVNDRHPDHSRASRLISRACFLSGLSKIKTSFNYVGKVVDDGFIRYIRYFCYESFDGFFEDFSFFIAKVSFFVLCFINVVVKV